MRVTRLKQLGGDPDHSSEMKLCRNLARMSIIYSFQASVLFSLDTMGWEAEFLDFVTQLGNIV